MRTNVFLIAIRDAPETNIVLFGFLISFPWEMLQAPLYVGMAAAVRACSKDICEPVTAILAHMGKSKL